MLRLLNGSHTCGGTLIRSRTVIGRCRSNPTPRNPAVDRPWCALHELQRCWASSQSSAGETAPRPAQDDATSPAPKQETGDADETRLPIRKYLRQWEKQNAQTFPQPMPHDATVLGGISNDLTRTQSTGSSEMDRLHSTRGGMTDDPECEGGNGEADEVLVLGTGSRTAGDLVELRATGSRVPLFAIYLGFFGQRNHFYAANGRWITSRGFSSLFTVSGFATPAELAPLMARIPLKASPEEFDELRREDKGPSRADAAVLIERMNNFRLKAESTYQANLERLDAARHELSDEHQAKHLTLTQIAEELLPGSLRKDGAFPAHALYAVHTALSRSEIGFRPLNPSSDCRRPDNLIEIFSKNDTAVVEKVALMLRDYSDKSIAKLRPPNYHDLADSRFGTFLYQARHAVLASRAKRQWTSHGILRPSSGVSLKDNAWTKTKFNKEIIDFLEWWATHDLFEPGSRFHNYGALILRALQIYDESVCLDQSTAWTLLQEIGVIAPWEMPSRFKVRFPGVAIEKGGGLRRPAPGNMDGSRRPDIASGARREHDRATIFCIDAPSTIIIDDGVSLERTSKAGEFWIHVHAADPASSIEPNSGLYHFMSLIPENIYLPGHFQAMLPADLGGDDSKDFESQSLIKQFSLKSGSPALTFSARVNEAGDVLDFKVEPSRLGDVVYIDPKEVAEFCNEPAPPPVPSRTLTAGTPPEGEAAAPNRDMIAAKDLDPSSKEDLRIMYRLAEAVRGKRLQKGAWPYFFPGPSVSVSLPKRSKSTTTTTSTTNGDGGMMAVPEEPFIKVSYEASTACSIVSNFMVLAGEVAARWCSARGIPIPYRRDILHAQTAERARAYAAREIYPLIARGVEPSISQRQELSRLTGGIELSSAPGPYFLLGLDMYAKATSPLRRFSDLLVHWQVHAALRHERAAGGRPLDPAVDDLRAVLPFSGPALDDALALLQMREKMARTMSRGVVDWILMALVRAWRFEGSAPKVLRFTVTSHLRQALLGRVDLFGLNATMDVERLGGLALLKDVRVGDQFDVELADVNAHSRQILVKALKYLGAQDKS